MKEIIYLYIVIGSYYAHRKTINVEMSDVEFFKKFLQYSLLYPKFLFEKYKKQQSSQDNTQSLTDKE